MTILYFDCQAGISGDMTVAALLDLGVPIEHLRAELLKLALPPGSYVLSTAATERHHVSALKFDVAVHDHHTHRHYAGIDAMIAVSGLADPVKDTARRIFRRLAEAEAKVHGVPIEEVHFHEVGAVDSIVDIVGAAVCLDYLKVERLYFSALPLGSGFVETAHGRLPVPAPATAELLQGVPLHGDCGPGERVTPTGAAIVAALADGFGKQPEMLLEKVGSGAGGKDFPDRPNILRAFLGKNLETGSGNSQVMVVETNIDDSTPEVLGYTMERLFEEGALDVWFTPIQMKKNRPAVQLSFLCVPDRLDVLSGMVLSETSAIGLRHYPANRTVLERCIAERETPVGTLRFKEVFDACGERLRAAPEYEDCRRIARERGVPLQQVLRTAADAADRSFDDVELAELLRRSGLTLALAESCTGGMIAQRISAVAGSSAYFLEGAVTYSNAAKTRQLGVPQSLLEMHGAVSAEVAAAMAQGIRAAAGSDLGLAVTGIAGPDGGTAEKPVGTVFIGCATPESCRAERFQFGGGREEIRDATALAALDWLRRYLLHHI
ncbi:MAG: nickel pincer cofactor biosynthesis protein LarC [Desulfuromonadales bacterium]